MKKLYIILTASVLISAVNVNTSYCMEKCTNELYESDTIREIREQYLESRDKLQNRFKKVYNIKISRYNTSELQKIEEDMIQCAIRLGSYLFNNNGKNLISILSSQEKKRELSYVYAILKDLFTTYATPDYQYLKTLQEARKRLVYILRSNKSLCNIISNIVNNISYSRDIDKKHFDCVIDSIKRIILISSVDLDVSFMEIYEMYQYHKNGHNTTEMQEQINKFVNGLFGTDGSNLLTVLSCDIEQELFFISYMLEEPDVKTYIKNKLRDNNQLLDMVGNIVQQYRIDNKYKTQVIDKIQQCLSSLYQENYY